MNKPTIDLKHGFRMPLVQRAFGSNMQPAMTGAAECGEIIQRVVTPVIRDPLPIAVNVVKVEAIGGSALNALVPITAKRDTAIPAQLVVLFGFLLVAANFEFIFVGPEPFMDFAHAALALAFIATTLRPGLVNELLEAGSTIQSRAERYYSACVAMLFKTQPVHLALPLRHTDRAPELVVGRRHESDPTLFARPLRQFHIAPISVSPSIQEEKCYG